MTETNTRPLSPNLSAREGPRTALIWLRFGFDTNTPRSRLSSRLISFDAQPSLEALAREQGILPVADFDALLANSWPDDESADDFLAAREQWRREGRSLDS
jgi:hypothetical protein